MIWQKNPLTVVGTLDRCWLFTYRTPAERVRSLLPYPLEPMTHAGYAFWNIVICHIGAMRPQHFPAFTGVDYWHLAYRLYVRLPVAPGKEIEGLYFLRSECDNRLMELLGNLLTDFRFHLAQLCIQQDQDALETPEILEILEIRLASPDAPAYVRLLPNVAPQHDPHSAFASLEEASAFLKYKPYGIALDKAGRANVVYITRDEAAWRSRLVQVEAADWAFLRGQDVEMEICYQIEPILYQWNRGHIYDLQHKHVAR